VAENKLQAVAPGAAFTTDACGEEHTTIVYGECMTAIQPQELGSTTTSRLGEEVTTEAVGEEGTSSTLGEEFTTEAVGEESPFPTSEMKSGGPFGAY
jgi:hypothetical protein